MKKFTVILFTALYLVSISGVAVNNFYCCGKFKESFLFDSGKSAKSCKGTCNMRKCCDTKTFLVKVKDSHSASQQLKINLSDFFTINFSAAHVSEQPVYYSTATTLFALIHAPPLLSKLPVYLSVNNFRI